MIVKNTWTESDVICDLIGERTFQASSDWLNESLPKDRQITRQTVYNWVVGKHEPDDTFLRLLQIFYPVGDPRHELGKTLTEMRIRALGKVS